MDDPDLPRLLSRTGTPAYTHVAMLALREEPEAISADEQWLLSERARQLHDDQLKLEWKKASSRVHGALEHFEKISRLPRDLEHQLRAVERCTRAIDRRFG